MSDLIVYGIVLHLIADWLLQNHWMAINKSNPKHPAGYVHAGIHAALFLLIFPPFVALMLGVAHWFIDLRWPLAAWRQLMRQTTDGPYAIHVHIWTDQVAHIVYIAVMAWIVTI
jgi:hypothetical protein